MTNLLSYWDDSENRYFRTMAGAIGSEEQWGKFNPEWERVLTEFSVSKFHATDFVAHQGEFRTWGHDEDKRRKFIDGLINVIGKSEFTVVCTAVYSDALERINTKWGHSYGSYSVSAATCAYELRNQWGPDAAIQVYLDRIDDWKIQLEDAEKLINSDPLYGPWWREEKVSWRAFTKTEMKEKIRGKEIADFAAWEFGAQFESKLGLSDRGLGGHWSGTRYSGLMLAASMSTNAKVYDDESLDQLYSRVAQGSAFPFRLPPV